MALDRGRLMRENRQISIQLDQRFNRVLAERNITGVQAHALLYVLQQAGKGASVTALHQVSGNSKATIFHLVKRLREKGYVRVELCAEDDRRRLLFGTEQGRQLQAALGTSFQTMEDILYRGFSPEELSDLDRLQQKMLRNLSETQREATKS